jgi:uncharacterized protein YndB with AHSA1/START domain
MTTISASALLPCPPEQAWALVADVTRMGDWSPETRSAAWIEGSTGPEVGARFEGHNQRGPLARWTTKCTVIEAEPGRVLAWSVNDPDPHAIWRYSFVPHAEGTMVTEACELLKAIPLKYKVGNLVFGVTDREADLKKGIEATLARLQVAARASTLSG